VSAPQQRAPLSFDVLARSRTCAARLGRVRTLHGDFDTPAFMPVGTRGTVKGVLPHDLAQTGAQVCLGNTYHLLLRPGSELIARRGGLHRFMNWPRAILTDSGGYQAYSMADLNTLSDEGVTFKSIVDGSMVLMTPERSMQVQNELGADIIMAFDDCPPSQAAQGEAGPGAHDPGAQDPGKVGAASDLDPRLARVLRRDKAGAGDAYARRVREANERTVRWLQRCKAAHARPSEQALFGIVQGGTDLDQRTWSARHITAIDLPGYAIGGVAVGEGFDAIVSVVRHTAPLLPERKPRYLMGVGYERDLLAAVMAGVDMFDCVLPTRNARNANAFTPQGQVRLRNARFGEDDAPIWPGDEARGIPPCDCLACAGWTDPVTGTSTGHFSRAYLRHLVMAEEMLGPMLISLHNLRHFQRFMADVRTTVTTDDWAGLVGRWPCAAPGLGE
jgi:queuine tRNA-ribosyltransferase